MWYLSLLLSALPAVNAALHHKCFAFEKRVTGEVRVTNNWDATASVMVYDPRILNTDTNETLLDIPVLAHEEDFLDFKGKDPKTTFGPCTPELADSSLCASPGGIRAHWQPSGELYYDSELNGVIGPGESISYSHWTPIGGHFCVLLYQNSSLSHTKMRATFEEEHDGQPSSLYFQAKKAQFGWTYIFTVLPAIPLHQNKSRTRVIGHPTTGAAHRRIPFFVLELIVFNSIMTGVFTNVASTSSVEISHWGRFFFFDTLAVYNVLFFVILVGHLVWLAKPIFIRQRENWEALHRGLLVVASLYGFYLFAWIVFYCFSRDDMTGYNGSNILAVCALAVKVAMFWEVLVLSHTLYFMFRPILVAREKIARHVHFILWVGLALWVCGFVFTVLPSFFSARGVSIVDWVLYPDEILMKVRSAWWYRPIPQYLVAFYEGGHWGYMLVIVLEVVFGMASDEDLALMYKSADDIEMVFINGPDGAT